MRHLSWFFGTLLFLLALGFAAKNSDTVVLHYFFGYQWQAPLVVMLLAAFFAGAIAGIVASLGFLFRQRREITRLRRELDTLCGTARKLPIPATEMPEAP